MNEASEILTRISAENPRVAELEPKVISIADAGQFTEAVVFPKKELFAEKTVRVYRGVNKLDASLLSQIPYAMRAEDSLDKAVTLENVRNEVDVLAHESTYKNLLAYVAKARPQLNERDAQSLEKDLREIEDHVLKGFSVRIELIYKQIEHLGGHPIDRGISPYVSAAWTPAEALGYTSNRGAVMVLDLPISEIEDLRSDSAETYIKGALDPRYITAILVRNGTDIGNPKYDIETALKIAAPAIQIASYTPEETKSMRETQLTNCKNED